NGKKAAGVCIFYPSSVSWGLTKPLSCAIFNGKAVVKLHNLFQRVATMKGILIWALWISGVSSATGHGLFAMAGFSFGKGDWDWDGASAWAIFCKKKAC